MNLSKTAFLIVCLLFAYFHAHSQKELVGLVDSKIVKIDSVTGKIELLFSINNIPSNEDIRSLTYDQNKNLFFTIRQSTNNPSLSSISGEGDYSIIGNFKLDGKQIKSVESLAFNSENNKLFASVSLNGGVPDNDFYSEAIVEVDPSTGVCSFVTEISTSAAYPDIDVMTFKDNLLFIYDGIPPSGNNYKFYELNLNTVGAISSPDQIFFKTPYLPIADFTAGDNIYIISNRNFYKFDFANNSLQYISQTHSSIEFNGKLITGISRFPSCSLPVLDLGVDIQTCEQDVILNATTPDATYKWQDNSTEPTFTASQSGIYWVEVTNACGSTKDTINVFFQNAPLISLGEDREICDPIVLDATSPGATYEWQDGSTDPVFTAKTPGMFWVEVKNSCGNFTDSVQLSLVEIKNPFIPNVFTPNGDQYNQHFQIDSRLEGSKVEIYNRWGRLVYISESYNNTWDGDGLAKGTYYYKIIHPCKRKYKGWISIL